MRPRSALQSPSVTWSVHRRPPLSMKAAIVIRLEAKPQAAWGMDQVGSALFGAALPQMGASAPLEHPTVLQALFQPHAPPSHRAAFALAGQTTPV